MHFGLFSINAYAAIEPRTAARVARAAEAAGFESLWAGEHVVLPDPQAPPSPMGPTEPILDPAIALTFAAANTTRVRLGTGIIILPQRNPLVLAKELASLDVLSAGRLIFGIGVGYLEPEFRALGAPVRGPRRGDRRVPRRDAGHLGASEAGLPGTLRLVRERAGAPAARPAAPSTVRDRRPLGAGVPTRREPGARLVRLRASTSTPPDGPWTACAPPRPRPRVRPGSDRWRSASRRAAGSVSISRPSRSMPLSACTG